MLEQGRSACRARPGQTAPPCAFINLSSRTCGAEWATSGPILENSAAGPEAALSSPPFFGPLGRSGTAFLRVKKTSGLWHAKRPGTARDPAMTRECRSGADPSPVGPSPPHSASCPPQTIRDNSWDFFLRGSGLKHDGSAHPAWLPTPVWMECKGLTNLEGFEKICDNITANEAKWKVWYQDDNPQFLPIPGDMELSPWNKLILLKAMRPEKLLFVIQQMVRPPPCPPAAVAIGTRWTCPPPPLKGCMGLTTVGGGPPHPDFIVGENEIYKKKY